MNGHTIPASIQAVTDAVRIDLPQAYHDAVEHWRQHNFPDYPMLAEVWDRFFPRDDAFCLCAKVQQRAGAQRTGEHAREIDDADAGERTAHVSAP